LLMTLARDWNISPPASTCAATGKKFQDGQPLVSILRETPRQLIRIDYSLEGWEKTSHTHQEIASRWHSEYRARPQRQEAHPSNDVESLLRRLIHIGAPADAPARFVLAVMLERKKRLKLVDTLQHGERRILVYEHAKTGESFLIEDPRLKLTELEPVERRIRQLLENPSAPLHITQNAPAKNSPPLRGWLTWLRRHGHSLQKRPPRALFPNPNAGARLRPLRGKMARARFILTATE
jgi:hypothetical protein